MVEKKNRWLLTVDLDGTLLKDSASGEMNKMDLEAIKKLNSLGHVVCIVTGRPWNATKNTYNLLELDTIVGNYNGARIHKPNDDTFVPEISYIDLNNVMYILGDKKLKKSISNIAIEGPSWVMIEHKDKDLERIFGFKDIPKYKTGINFNKIPLKPTGVIFDTKLDTNVVELQDYLTRKYGDLAEFSSWSKGEGKSLVFDITSKGITKAKVVSLLSRYYDIPISRTISIGDSYNDLPMFQISEISVAMGNSPIEVKSKATYITNKTNKKAGVAEFVNKFLNDDGSFIKSLKAKRRKIYSFKQKITKAN